LEKSVGPRISSSWLAVSPSLEELRIANRLRWATLQAVIIDPPDSCGLECPPYSEPCGSGQPSYGADQWQCYGEGGAFFRS
jgi:hypothetical protein